MERAKPMEEVIHLNNRLTRRPHLLDLRADFIDQEKAKRNGTCRTIAICNLKGGVGKTVTAINLSARLATRGLRTLLIDLDPQGQSGLGLGLDVDRLEHSVYDVLVNGRYPACEVIVPLRSNLDVLPSNIDLSSAELELARFQHRERRLKKAIEGLRNNYEYIVIDCPPSIGILTLNALVASQIVVIPVTPSQLSIQGLSGVLKVAEALKDSLLLKTSIFCLITLFDRRQKEARIQKEKLELTEGHRLLKTVVRKNTKLNTATRKGIPVFEYDSNCSGTRDYTALTEEVLSIGCGEDRLARKEILPLDSLELRVTQM